MKKRTQHNAAQFELGFASEPMALVGEILTEPAPAPSNSAGLVDPKQLEMNKPASYTDRNAPEYKVAKVRDCAWPDDKSFDNPEPCAEFWRAHIESAAWYRSEQESFCVLMLNTRRKMIGFSLVTLGTLDTCYASVLEVFRIAIMKAAPAIILAHNHPSGDSSPSEADIKVTRDLVRAGELLKISVLDSIVIGRASATKPQGWTSLRELGYFYDHK